MNKCAAMESIRVAFNFRAWNPTQEEWMFAAQCIQAEEKTRLAKYIFKKDAKATMAGRLLIRKVLSSVLKIPYHEVQLARTDKGKPFLMNSLPDPLSNFSFNVSHSGDYAVLAAESSQQVGVDVMKVEPPPGKTIDEFFYNMRRQFTDSEWSVIGGGFQDKGKLLRFYRHWCLKEGFVKSLGVGIGFSLQRLSFQMNTKELAPAHVVTDTCVNVDGSHDPRWQFEESLLGDDHVVAVALKDVSDFSPTFHDHSIPVIDYMPVSDTDMNWGHRPGCPFSLLSFGDIMDVAVPQTDPDFDFWLAYDSKMEHPPRRKQPPQQNNAQLKQS